MERNLTVHQKHHFSSGIIPNMQLFTAGEINRNTRHRVSSTSHILSSFTLLQALGALQ